MLSKRQKRILANHLKAEKSKSNFFPEEEALFKKKTPGPGLHIHDENNPFGIHRHLLGDEIDGAHVHSPQNPRGEHVHGLKEGQALIDGAHTHDRDGLGWHNHTEDYENFGLVPVEKPGLKHPEINPETPDRE